MSFSRCKIAGTKIDGAVYRSQPQRERGTIEFVMSASALREGGICWSRWRKGYAPPASAAKDFGSLLDCLYLTPELFAGKYVPRPETYRSEKGEEKPWNNNANFCREWNEAVEAAGQKPLKKSELSEALAAVDSLNRDEVIKSFIAQSDTQVWLKGIWLDETTGIEIPVQALLDVAPKADSVFSPSLADVKTTQSAKPSVWERYSSKRQYHLQAAFYLDFWNAATGENRDTFCHILVENFPPWQTGKSIVSQQKIECGRMLYKAYLSQYAQCLSTGLWPDYQHGPNLVDGWSVDAATKWDEMEAMAAMEGIAPVEELPPIETEIENLN